MTPIEISVAELHKWRAQKRPHQLIDVREPFEHEGAHLPDDVLIPMGEFLARLNEVNADSDVVIYCRTGSRSGQVVNYLRRQGYENVTNLAGGIVDWVRTFGPV